MDKFGDWTNLTGFGNSFYDYGQQFFQDANNTFTTMIESLSPTPPTRKSMVATPNIPKPPIKELSQQELEQIIALRGELKGAVLAPDVDVSQFEFNGIKVDQRMLDILIKRRANLAGVDLSYELIEYVDLTGVQMPGSNCNGTIFRYTPIKGTNFTGAQVNEDTVFDQVVFDETNCIGVDLSKPKFNSVSVTSIIIGDDDKQPYIAQYTNRLNRLFNVKCVENNESLDLFNLLDRNLLDQFRRDLLYQVTTASTVLGKTSLDEGPQDIVVKGDLRDEFDERIVKKVKCEFGQVVGLTPQELRLQADHAKQKLLFEHNDGGFTDTQKALFHHSRSLVNGLLKFNLLIVDNISGDNSTISSELHQDFCKQRMLSQIYIEGESDNEPRVCPQLMEACFNHVAALYSESLTPEQIKEVRDLFLSPNYRWP